MTESALAVTRSARLTSRLELSVAKKTSRARTAGSDGPHGSVEKFAEDLGTLLGTAQAKAENWLSQRQDIAKHLTDIRDTASGLLKSLSGESPFPWRKLKQIGRAHV